MKVGGIVAGRERYNVTFVRDDDQVRMKVGMRVGMKVGMKDGMKGILGRWLVFRLNSLFFRNKEPKK